MNQIVLAALILGAVVKRNLRNPCQPSAKAAKKENSGVFIVRVSLKLGEL
jgi:hypothetical protein